MNFKKKSSNFNLLIRSFLKAFQICPIQVKEQKTAIEVGQLLKKGHLRAGRSGVK